MNGRGSLLRRLLLRAQGWICWITDRFLPVREARRRVVERARLARLARLEHVALAGSAFAQEEAAQELQELNGLQDVHGEHDAADALAEDALPYGDFASAEEAERFAALPPIAAESAEDVDWDLLARELSRGA